MTTIEERVITLEQEVAGMKAILVGQFVPERKDWESTVGVFENDPLFGEALRLGREYRESQFQSARDGGVPGVSRLQSTAVF